MDITLVFVHLHLYQQELHLACIIANCECYKVSFRYELVTLFYLKRRDCFYGFYKLLTYNYWEGARGGAVG